MNGDGYQYKKGATENISPLIYLMGRKGIEPLFDSLEVLE